MGARSIRIRAVNEDAARRVWLVRSVEIEDRGEALLTAEDRQRATASSLPAPPGDEGGFLSRRADFAVQRLETRFPAVARVLRHARWPRWIDWAVPLGALVLALVAHQVSTGHRLNILAFPLVGMLVWNLAVYLGLIVAGLRGVARRDKPAALHGPAGWIARLAERASERGLGEDPMGRALRRFAQGWWRASSPLTGHRVARTFHLGAALFAAGVIGGIYLRALGIEYRAGWESTFLDPAAVHRLIGALLGPASAVSGVPLPGLSELAALRWTPSGGGGENAGRFIHLYAVTALGFIIVPRLMLASWHAVAAWRGTSRFEVPGTEDFYVRRLLRGARGGQGSLRVTPYAFRLPDVTARRLTDLLGAALGDGARVAYDRAVEYGAEDEWLAAAAFDPSEDHRVVLFNLSATPEAENHGAFVAALRQRLPGGTALGVLIDEAAYRERLGAEGEARIDQRRAAWKAMLGGVGMSPLFVDLAAAGDDSAAIRRLEGALVHDAGLSVQ